MVSRNLKKEKTMPKTLRRLFWLAVIAICLAATASLAVYTYLYVTVGRNPNRASVEYVLRRPKVMSKIVFADGSTICEVGLERRITAMLKNISKPMILAILATEDDKFFEHGGVNYKCIVRAALHNLMVKLTHHGVSQGASTITQQIVKNMLLTSEQKMERKISEFFLSKELERYMVQELGSEKAAKEMLLEIYLNWINFDRGRYGVETASWYYFGHSAATLDWNEALALAAIPKNPSLYNPRRHPEKNLARRKALGSQAVRLGYLSKEELDKALKKPLNIVSDRVSSGEIAQWICDSGVKRLEATYCTELDLHSDNGRLACKQVLSSLGIIEKTSIRKDAQEAVLDFLNRGLSALSVRHPKLNKIASKERAKRGKKENVVSGVVIAIDNKTGHVIIDAVSPYDPGSLNLAFAPQQPGSTMKPILYATGFDMGAITPESVFVDQESRLDKRHPDKVWPVNYEPEYLGPINVRHALAESVNTVAVQVIAMIDASNVISKAKQLGVLSPLANERSLALGASAISPLEMAGAYATFARGGEYIQPLIFTAIGNKKIMSERRRVLTPTAASMVQDVTRAVIEEGTGRRVKGKLPVPSYGKTGTTSGHTDAWFALFTADYTVVVWVGHRERQTLGAYETGASAALPIALDTMHYLYTGKPAGAVYAMPTKEIDDSKLIEGEIVVDEVNLEAEQVIVEEAPPDIVIPDDKAKPESEKKPSTETKTITPAPQKAKPVQNQEDEFTETPSEMIETGKELENE
jgi:membrane peptidoglycan carboxypeptidase